MIRASDFLRSLLCSTPAPIFFDKVLWSELSFDQDLEDAILQTGCLWQPYHISNPLIILDSNLYGSNELLVRLIYLHY